MLLANMHSRLLKSARLVAFCDRRMRLSLELGVIGLVPTVSDFLQRKPFALGRSTLANPDATTGLVTSSSPSGTRRQQSRMRTLAHRYTSSICILT
jgi:hypothetical protein